MADSLNGGAPSFPRAAGIDNSKRAGELVSPTRHEYLGGFVYAMAGRRHAHNLIADTPRAQQRLGSGVRCRPGRPLPPQAA